MKAKGLVLILVSACLAFAAITGAQAGARITFGVPDQESFPNILGKEDIVDPPGIYLEMLRRVAADLGIEARFVRLPTKRIMKYLCDGVIDVAVEFSFVQERTECGRYPMKRGEVDSERRLDSLSYHLYTRENSSLAWDGKRFTNLTGRLGANVGYSIVDELIAMGLEVETTTDTESNLLKVQYGRISGYVQVSNKADVFLQSGKISGIRKHPIPVRSKPYYIMFSHQYYARNPELVERIWTRLGEIRDDMIVVLRPKYMKLQGAK